MRKVVTNAEVPHLWAHQSQPEGRNSNGSLWFEGRTIYSYGRHFPIARFVDNKRGETAVLITTRGYSSTTSQHIGNVRAAITHLSPVFRVPLTDRFDLKSAIPSYRERIKEQSVTVVRAKSNRDSAYLELVALVDEANKFAEFFALRQRFVVPEDLDALGASLAETAKRAREKAKRDAQKLAKANAIVIQQWREGARVPLPNGLADIYLRVEGNEVVTSKGARFPVDHALRAFRFVQAVKAKGETYYRNGHTIHVGPYVIDSVDQKGNVRAGCHFVKWDEIQRIGEMLGV